MKTAFLCLCFLTLTVSAVRLEPDSDLFFSFEFIKLTCEGQTDGWTVKRTRTGSKVETCGRGQDFGESEGSSCALHSPSLSDSGTYWCQDRSGTKSPEVHLNVTGGDLILDSPVLPVETGSDVTLRCRVRAGSGVNPVIYRNRTLFQSSPDWTISDVSRSDQGLYSCSGLKSGLRVTSEERWLRVKDPPTTPPPSSTSLSPTSSSLSPTDPLHGSSQNSVLVQVGAAVGSLVLLVLVLVLVLLRRQRQRGDRTGSGGPEAEAEEVTYADVTVRRAADRPAPAPEEDTVYSGVRTHAAGSEVTYGQVVVKPKKKKKRVQTDEPWADPDVVYSSVRVRNSAGQVCPFGYLNQ